MGSIYDKVHYCCVWKGNQILYAYNRGEDEIEALAALCLERTPPFHKWYFETVGRRTFGFLIEDGYVYFTMVDKVLANPVVLQFLQRMRDEFKKVAKSDFKGSFSNMILVNVQEEFVPVIRNLINSLEHVSQSSNEREAESETSSPSDLNAEIEAASSTKAPLLRNLSKKKKKQKDHVISIRDIELEEHWNSSDRVKVDSEPLDSNNHHGASSSISSQKDFGSARIRSGAPNIPKKWCHLLRIFLAIDAVVCLVIVAILLFVYLGVL
ncbi:hypothetical protein SLE2022_117000 [Rubroshorea leprosula]